MRVLGIETSCDETGVALFEEGKGIVAERLASQVAIHAPFGGVVPELASRDHIAKLLPLVEDVLGEADVDFGDLDAIAYTAGPGLIGALMVGGSFAASLCYALRIPAVPVHHLEGHLLACMLERDAPAIGSSARRSTTRPAKRSTWSHACSVCRIRAVRSSLAWRTWATATATRCRGRSRIKGST